MEFLHFIFVLIFYFSTGPLTRFLLDCFGWRGTLMVYSGVCLQGTVFNSLYRAPPADRKRKETAVESNLKIIKIQDYEAEESSLKYSSTPNGNTDPFITTAKGHKRTKHSRKAAIFCANAKNIIDWSVLKHKSFVIFAISAALANYGFQTNQMHLPSRALVMGIPDKNVQYLPLCMGLSNAVGNLVGGVLARKIDMSLLTAIAMIISGVFQGLAGFTGSSFFWNVAAAVAPNLTIGKCKK